MAAPTPLFAPADNLLADTPTALQLKTWLGEVLGFNRLGMEVTGMLPTKRITTGSSFQLPVAGRALKGKYHVRGEDVQVESGYLQTVPFTEKVMYIDDPFTQNAIIPDYDQFQTHYESRSIITRELAEALARYSDFKAIRTIISAARADANIPVGVGVVSGQQTFAGESWNHSTTASTVADLKNAAMNTDGSKIVLALIAAAQVLDEKRAPAKGRVFLCRPSQKWALVNDRQLLDRNVVYRDNGDFAEGEVYKCAGITIKMVTGLADAQTANAGLSGEAATHVAANGSYLVGSNLSNNAGVVFCPGAAWRLVRSPLEMLVYFEKRRWADVVQMRTIDGFDRVEPSYAVELSLS